MKRHVTATALPRQLTAIRKEAIGLAVVAVGSKTCPTCGYTFTPANPRQVHCRPSCRHQVIATNNLPLFVGDADPQSLGSRTPETAQDADFPPCNTVASVANRAASVANPASKEAPGSNDVGDHLEGRGDSKPRHRRLPKPSWSASRVCSISKCYSNQKQGTQGFGRKTSDCSLLNSNGAETISK